LRQIPCDILIHLNVLSHLLIYKIFGSSIYKIATIARLVQHYRIYLDVMSGTHKSCGSHSLFNRGHFVYFLVVVNPTSDVE